MKVRRTAAGVVAARAGPEPDDTLPPVLARHPVHRAGRASRSREGEADVHLQSRLNCQATASPPQKNAGMWVGAHDAAVAWHVGAGALGLVASEVAVGSREEQHVAVLDVALNCCKLQSICVSDRVSCIK